MLNPTAKIAKSEGIDLPIMNVYLAGRIAGECMDKCLAWRDQLIQHYRNYKPIYGTTGNFNRDRIAAHNDNLPIVGYESYPIAFLCPLNSGENKSCDAKGLTSHIPPNLIYSKDILSLEKADVIVANLEDYFEEGIEDLVNKIEPRQLDGYGDFNYPEGFYRLQNKIRNRRENFGTICEFAIALYLQKPIITIVPESRKEIYMKHPFASRASAIVTSVDQLIREKWLNILYKSMSGAIHR